MPAPTTYQPPRALLDDVRAAGSITAALETLGARVFGPGTPLLPPS